MLMMKTTMPRSFGFLRLPTTLSTRMTTAILILLLLVTVPAATLIIIRDARTLGQNHKQLTQQLVTVSRPVMVASLAQDDLERLQEYLVLLSDWPMLTSLAVTADNQPAYRFIRDNLDPSVRPDWLTRHLLPPGLLATRKQVTLSHDGKIIGTATFGFSFERLNESIESLVIQTVAIAAAMLLILLSLTLLVMDHLTSPLKPLTRMASRLSQGAWQDDLDIGNRDSREVREIKTALAQGSKTIRHYVKSLEDTRVQLSQSEHRLRHLINGMHEALFEIDADGRITFLNPAWQAITGLTVEQSLGRPFTEFLAVENDRQVFAKQKLTRLVQKNRELKLLTSNPDNTVWVTLDASAQKDPEDKFTGVVGTLGDITESVELNHMLSEYQEELYHLSVTDPLTGLYNRRHFDTQFDLILVDHIKAGNPLCLMLIDIDGFKFINDTYGHPFGDKVLQAVGDLLADTLEPEHYLARIGGDEFAIVLTDTTLESATRRANRVHKQINDTRIPLPVGQMRIQCSIGAAGSPHHGDNVQDMVRAADVALYQSKRAGRNRIRVLTPDADKATMTIFNKGFQLRDALENGDINPVFQPICDIQTGEPMAYEVLARMMHNDTIIPAKEFITIAEELGLTRDVDLHIIGQALKLAPRDHTLFLNVGLSSFNDRGFVSRLYRLLQHARHQGQPITIEITERDIVPLTDELRDDINSLRAMGCKLALDDFGSGYSTYHFLNFFRPDFIKIEGTFVQGMTHSDTDRRIVEHIHELAVSFGMQSIAENIENEATLVALRKIGVNSGQGMYFGSPRFLN